MRLKSTIQSRITPYKDKEIKAKKSITTININKKLILFYGKLMV